MPKKNERLMKTVDVLAAVILIIGGINWGLVGLFNFNLVAMIFGSMSAMSRIIYILVGLAAFYEAFSWKIIQKRWECRSYFSRPESASSQAI